MERNMYFEDMNNNHINVKEHEAPGDRCHEEKISPFLMLPDIPSCPLSPHSFYDSKDDEAFGKDVKEPCFFPESKHSSHLPSVRHVNDKGDIHDVKFNPTLKQETPADCLANTSGLMTTSGLKATNGGLTRSSGLHCNTTGLIRNTSGINGNANGLNGNVNSLNGHANGLDGDANGNGNGLDGNDKRLNGNASGLNGNANGLKIKTVNDDEHTRTINTFENGVGHHMQGGKSPVEIRYVTVTRHTDVTKPGQPHHARTKVLQAISKDKYSYQPISPLKPFACYHCGKTFAHICNLKEHRRAHTTRNDIICTECGKSFALRCNFNAHVKKQHTRGAIHTCLECGKVFSHMKKLFDHNREHTGEKPYKCNECIATFGNKIKLKQHKRKHAKTFQCEACGKSFATKANLRQHERIHISCNMYESFNI